MDAPSTCFTNEAGFAAAPFVTVRCASARLRSTGTSNAATWQTYAPTITSVVELKPAFPTVIHHDLPSRRPLERAP